MNAPEALRVEHLGDRVLGLGVRAPRLSWRLPTHARRQLAYELEIDDRSSGRIDSAEHVLVAWPTDPLGSAKRVRWRVKVWTDRGESEWSEPGCFETALLDASDWHGQWIE